MPAASGMNGSYGTDTGSDPRRQAHVLAGTYGLAARFHYEEGITAEQVKAMAPDEWDTKAPGSDQKHVADMLRAYEHYAPPGQNQ